VKSPQSSLAKKINADRQIRVRLLWRGVSQVLKEGRSGVGLALQDLYRLIL